MIEKPTTRMPAWIATMTSGTVDMPTTHRRQWFEGSDIQPGFPGLVQQRQRALPGEQQCLGLLRFEGRDQSVDGNRVHTCQGSEVPIGRR